MTDDHKAEALARAIYDTDPWFDNGERLLTFDEAKSRGLLRNAASAADAILARFNVTERDEGDWEIGCMSVAHRSYENPRGIVALDSMIRPEEHGEECPSPFLVRRHPASEWEVFDV